MKFIGFTYSARGVLTKHPQRIQKLKEASDLHHLYKNELYKAYFAHDAAYANSIGLAKRTVSEKILNARVTNLH